ncbi:MAG TPA: hypothetical protein VMT17_03050 [Anaeromyxobacteraceae bacterium]|nr:hypothetical protein [Anaeromyxobacteraceae bacterium]
MTLRALFMAFVVAIVGCGGTETDEQTAAVVPGEEAALTQSGHTISGTVIGLSHGNVGLRKPPFLPGDAVMRVTTSASGTYSFTGVADGTYRVIPLGTCNAGSVGGGSFEIFSPPSIEVTVSGRNVTGVNFKRVGCGGIAPG